MTLEWRLRRVMAECGIWTGAELARLLRERAGYRLTAPSIGELVSRSPRQLKVETLDALCTALECSPSDLLVHTPSRRQAQVTEEPKVINGTTPSRGNHPRPAPPA